MSRNTLTLIIGIVIMLMPFSGFPPTWKTVVYVIAGLVLIILAVNNYLRRRARQSFYGGRQ